MKPKCHEDPLLALVGGVGTETTLRLAPIIKYRYLHNYGIACRNVLVFRMSKLRVLKLAPACLEMYWLIESWYFTTDCSYQ